MITTLLVGWSAAAVAVPTLLLTIALVVALARTRRPRSPSVTTGPSVNLVRPICGREHAPDRKNLSLLRQDYAPLTVAFVAESETDSGLSDAQRVCVTEGAGTCLVVGDVSAVSGKARNMIAGWRASDSEIVGFCDSDIELSKHDVGRCVAAMLDTGASAAFAPCLFAAEGGWGGLAMQLATIDKFTLAEAGAALGIVPCLEGGLMLVSRSALESAGGIEVVGRAIADDLRIGGALREHGFRLGMSAVPIVHRTGRESARSWAQRYLRWSICRRTEAPWVQLGGLALNPILVPLVVAVVAPNPYSWVMLLVGVLWRIGYAQAVSRLLLAPHGVRIEGWCWARPVAEILDAVFIVVAFLTRSLTWRGNVYDVDFRGRITRREPRAAALRRRIGVGTQRGTPRREHVEECRQEQERAEHAGDLS